MVLYLAALTLIFSSLLLNVAEDNVHCMTYKGFICFLCISLMYYECGNIFKFFAKLDLHIMIAMLGTRS